MQAASLQTESGGTVPIKETLAVLLHLATTNVEND